MLPFAKFGTEVYLFGGAGVISLLAFTTLILAPALGSFTRTWEKVTAAVLSIFVLIALLAVGLAIGAAVVFYWSDIRNLFT